MALRLNELRWRRRKERSSRGRRQRWIASIRPRYNTLLSTRSRSRRAAVRACVRACLRTCVRWFVGSFFSPLSVQYARHQDDAPYRVSVSLSFSLVHVYVCVCVHVLRSPQTRRHWVGDVVAPTTIAQHRTITADLKKAPCREERVPTRRRWNQSCLALTSARKKQRRRRHERRERKDHPSPWRSDRPAKPRATRFHIFGLSLPPPLLPPAPSSSSAPPREIRSLSPRHADSSRPLLWSLCPRAPRARLEAAGGCASRYSEITRGSQLWIDSKHMVDTPCSARPTSAPCRAPQASLRLLSVSSPSRNVTASRGLRPPWLTGRPNDCCSIWDLRGSCHNSHATFTSMARSDRLHYRRAKRCTLVLIESARVSTWHVSDTVWPRLCWRYFASPAKQLELCVFGRQWIWEVADCRPVIADCALEILTLPKQYENSRSFRMVHLQPGCSRCG